MNRTTRLVIITLALLLSASRFGSPDAALDRRHRQGVPRRQG